ncbi:hypothetical protein ACU8KH_00554 [Lachancea thermotolerans]
MKSFLGLTKLGNSGRKKVAPDQFSHIKSGMETMGTQDYEPLKPLLILLDCQKRKPYVSWDEGNELLLQVRGLTEVLPVRSLALQGTQLRVIVEPEDNGYDNVMVLDVANGVSPSGWKLGQTSLELNDGAMVFLCRSAEAQAHLQFLYDMCMLSRFESMSLYKALTATVISTHGSRISDISSILMSQRSYKDWCYISINGEWVKAWCHVDRSPKHSDSRKGRHQVKFFRDDKSLTAKNLICYIPDCGDIEDLFFVEDQSADLTQGSPDDGFGDLHFQNHLNSVRDQKVPLQMSLEPLLTRLTTLRFIGDVYWPAPSSNSTSSRSRSSTVLSFGAGNSNNESPKKSRDRRAMSTSSTSMFTSPKKSVKHTRTRSTVSVTSTVHHADVNDACAITSELLIKPIPHSGVTHLESLIRAALPMMGCLSLYGRPVHFKNTREDIDSLLFALPKLPVIDYFAAEELPLLFQYVGSVNSTAGSLNKTLTAYKRFLHDRLQEPGRDKRSFTTLSDLLQNTSKNTYGVGSSRSTSSSPLM